MKILKFNFKNKYENQRNKKIKKKGCKTNDIQIMNSQRTKAQV